MRLDFSLVMSWLCSFLINNPFYPFYLLSTFPVSHFFVRFWTDPAVYCTLCGSHDHLPPSQFQHRSEWLIVLCRAEADVYRGMEAGLWSVWNRLKAPVPWTILIRSLHWLLVYHIFGTYCVGNDPNASLSSSIGYASNNGRLPPCIVYSYVPLGEVVWTVYVCAHCFGRRHRVTKYCGRDSTGPYVFSAFVHSYLCPLNRVLPFFLAVVDQRFDRVFTWLLVVLAVLWETLIGL